MDQIKIGKFIAQQRKEQKYTQEELAEKLSVSSKTVSRWETGVSMPDLSIIPNLCQVLGITINELLSGEKLSESEYQRKLEENIIINMDLLKNKIKKVFNLLIITVVIFIIGILSFVVYQEIIHIKVPIDKNNIEVSVCKYKQGRSVILSVKTKDYSPIVVDFKRQGDVMIISKVYKYLGESETKELSSETAVTIDEEINSVMYDNQIIYTRGDEVGLCQHR